MKEVDSVEAEAVVDCFFFLFVIDLIIMVSSNRPVSFLTFGFGKVVVLAFFEEKIVDVSLANRTLSRNESSFLP